MGYLKHHGIKGQKWGVRRFQNNDGSLTPAGRLRYGQYKEYSRDAEKANDIYNTLTEKEKHFLTGDVFSENSYDSEYQNEYNYESAIYSSIIEMKDVPVSMIDIYGSRTETGAGRIAIATRNDEQFRNAGLSKAAVEKALNWFNNNPDMMELEWDAFTENTKSWKLAEKFGFERDEYESYGGVEVYKKMKPERKAEYDKKRIYDNERVSKEIKRYIDDVNETIAIKEKNKKEHKKDSLVSINTLEKTKKAYSMIFSHPEYYLNEKGQLYYNGRYYTNVWLLANDLERSLK